MSNTDNAIALVERGHRITVETEEQYISAAEYLKASNDLKGRIEDHYKPLKAAAQQLHKSIVAAEKDQLGPIDMIIAKVKGLMLGYQERQAKLAAAAAPEAEAPETMSGSEYAAVNPINANGNAPKVSGVSNRQTWRAEVVNSLLIPREYLIPDMSLLNELAKRMKREDIGIPGVRGVLDKNVVVRG